MIESSVHSGSEITPLNREAWLAERRGGIGASEVGAILGLSPWDSPLEVYLRKVGKLADSPPGEAMRFGLALEPVILSAYCERFGGRIAGCQVFRKLDGCPLFATADAVLEDGRLVEAKTVGLRNRHYLAELGPEGTDQVPESWLVQVQAQLLCHRAEEADLAVLVGGQELRRYTVRRDDALAELIPRAAADFWEAYVAAGVAPPVHKPGDYELIARLHPGTDGSEVELDDEAEEWVSMIELYEDTRKRCEDNARAARARLLAALGDAASGRLPGGRRILRRVVAVGPATVKEHVREGYSYTRLILPKGEGKASETR